ncbi:MAG: hypothetical protein M9892_03345 [Bacteroidetes bacterium]|nr:hypothetical protein [Bacteroidota bacterium]
MVVFFISYNGSQVYLVPTLEIKIMNWIKRLFKKQTIVEQQTQALNIPIVSGRSEQFSCPLPDARCDRHKIDDEEGRWEFCNTCKREWAR